MKEEAGTKGQYLQMKYIISTDWQIDKSATTKKKNS